MKAKKRARPGFTDLISMIRQKNGKAVKDLSFDIYCPKTYSHHVRFTAWIPGFYERIITPTKLASRLKTAITGLRVRKVKDYVCGLNSKLNQYKDIHLLMLDLDTCDERAERELRRQEGALLRSGRGYHFIAFKAIRGRKAWENKLKRLLKVPALKKHIDRRHTYISLNRGYSTLRITNSPVKPMKVRYLKTLTLEEP